MLAIRVLVEDVKDCYGALGVVHAQWRPIPGEFDDYIAMPKANMYQSLHTAVLGPEAKPLEIQIRTREMHRGRGVRHRGALALQGGQPRRPPRTTTKLAWLRQLMDWRATSSDATEFVEC